MNKKEFLDRLAKGLSGLPEEDLNERLAFYSEMIDDRIEDGLSEEEAVGEIGSADEIVCQIISEYPLTKLVKERIKPKRKIRAWEIVLLVLGSPIWITLIAVAIAVFFALYASLCAVIVSFWAGFSGLVAGAFGGIVSGVALMVLGHTLSGVVMLGSGIFASGLSIFAFFGCRAATKVVWLLTKKCVVGIKNLIMGKGETK